VSAGVRETIWARRASGARGGITSICSAHPVVIEVALARGLRDRTPVLIEATCNQVNQEGGYTGMRPRDFRRFVEEIADRVGFARDALILGGDHLGPHPWKQLPPASALARAEEMVAAYVEAGFSKIHLDASMGCAGEPPGLDDETTAARASRLAEVAEAATASAGTEPVAYVIGTEVPTPGGALAGLEHPAVTTPEAVARTIEVHRDAFLGRGLGAAFERVVAVVVQPGVEFGDDFVMHYDRARARQLSSYLDSIPGLVFEAHSTDYQTAEGLGALVADGFAVLKVGPWLTFALREALYGLDQIACQLYLVDRGESVQATMERLMCASPDQWRKYYRGDATEQRIKRHYSYSDRIRYYWPEPEAEQAVARLLARFGDRWIPAPLVSQYLTAAYPGVAAGSIPATARELLKAMVRVVIDKYEAAALPRA
jgi:D-tagatose-bisphosphate aldolase class II non-catalytic subunit